jgi:hypothetical protein
MNEEVDYATIDSINERLDELADRHFHSIESVESTIGGIFSDHGIKFPGGLSEEEDTIFKLEGSDNLFLYIIVDHELVGYNVFAQILQEEDIIDIQDSIDVDEFPDFLTRVRHSADD